MAPLFTRTVHLFLDAFFQIRLDRAEAEIVEANGKMGEILDFVRPLKLELDPAGDQTPPSVRVIRCATSWIRRRRGLAAVSAAAVALGVWLSFGIYTIANGESAVLLRWGRITADQIGPGLHLRLPGIDRVYRARTGDVLRLEIDADRSSALHLLTGDENLIETDLVIQYRIAELGSYLLGTGDVEEIIRHALQAKVRP